jgi:hypothetical protein
MAKQAMKTLAKISKTVPTVAVPTDAPRRGSVQTVRMDRDTLKALKDACWERGVSQNDAMLGAIRRDLGLE